MKNQQNKEARELALEAARIAAGLHCTEVVFMDITGKSPATDYYVIATGTSSRQMRTVADEISLGAREHGKQRSGYATQGGGTRRPCKWRAR